MEASGTQSESQLRQMNITELAEEARSAWSDVKGRIPSDVLTQIEPHFNVLTDPSYVKQFAKSGGSNS